MQESTIPGLRQDLEFFPVQHEGKQFILIRDHLGLVQEGKAVGIPLYQLMTMLDGRTTTRDLQMALMRQSGGMFVAGDEVGNLIAYLDDSYILDSERFKSAKNRVVSDFASRTVRPCSHGGRAYPADPVEVARMLDDILGLDPPSQEPAGTIISLVAPHIDLSAGGRVYARGYSRLKDTSPETVLILGTGHHLVRELFSLTDKTFVTPLGETPCDRRRVFELRSAGGTAIARNDFVHRSEHSIEFQVLFLQHCLPKGSFAIVPILCGGLKGTLGDYSRQAYLDRAGPLLEALKNLVSNGRVLVIAGVDFSHIGPKFGHDRTADSLRKPSEDHDRALLSALSLMDADTFWEESKQVQDRYHVCGFPALACLLEILPPCTGHILDYEMWHERATASAVSFAALAFTGG